MAEVTIGGTVIRVQFPARSDRDYAYGYVRNTGRTVVVDYEQTGYATASEGTRIEGADGYVMEVAGGTWVSRHVSQTTTDDLINPEDLDWDYPEE